MAFLSIDQGIPVKARFNRARGEMEEGCTRNVGNTATEASIQALTLQYPLWPPRIASGHVFFWSDVTRVATGPYAFKFVLAIGMRSRPT